MRWAQCATGQHWVSVDTYTDSVKHQTPVARVTQEAGAGLERLKRLEDTFAAAPRNSRQRRTLRTAIRVEADAYRKSLDVEQATATHDAHPRLAGTGHW
jgi:hypothetical protein